jgi:hypothetical protein
MNVNTTTAKANTAMAAGRLPAKPSMIFDGTHARRGFYHFWQCAQ